MIKVVENSKATSAANLVGGEISGVKLVPLSENGGLQCSLVNFYYCRLSETCMYPHPTWYPVMSMDGLPTSLMVGRDLWLHHAKMSENCDRI